MPATPSLRLDIQPSARLVAALTLAHFAALAAAFLALSGWERYLVSGLVLGSLGRSLAGALLLGSEQARSLELGEDRRASWKNRDGTWREGRLGASHFISAMFAVVELRDSQGRASRVVLMPDSVPPEDFRKLRVWLRWRPGPARQGPE